MTTNQPAGPRNYDTRPPRVTLSLDPGEADLRAVLYYALRAQESNIHNGAERGKPAEEMTAAEVHELIKATIRAAAYEVAKNGRGLEENDRIVLPTLAGYCSRTATALVHRVYGEPSTDPRADGTSRR